MTDSQPLSSNQTQVLKANQRRETFAGLLREMFQLNQPELDFGLYRIMHARKDDINRFIERDLPRITQEAFANFASSDKAELQRELDKAIAGAQALDIDPDSLDKVKKLKAQLGDSFDLAREEGEVYDALVTFFKRYYDEGDFLSRRVYKNGTYAIPYQGEEVVLHWANKDQYYIKSSETLRDYSFRLNTSISETDPNPMRVHFKLVDADAGAQNNNKESDSSKRVFVLDNEQPFELIEGEANENGQAFNELQLRFVFRAATLDDWQTNNATLKALGKATTAAKKKPPVQAVLVSAAVEWLLSTESQLPVEWQEKLAQSYTKANGELAEYSQLQGQLNNYTKKNSFDYFIHKDLGGFLTRELDFYIKNELLDWDDLASLKHNTARLAPLLSKIEVIRSLGEKIIAFLAQLENFQKKLWLKKKFVTDTQYCITLDRLADHEALLAQIFDNRAQRDDWSSLYALDLEQLAQDLQQQSIAQLLEQPKYRFLILDTRHFDEAFKAQLLATIDDLDEQCDGLLVHSENFQALNLLQERYKEQVKCIYIDPPYNTDGSAIAYKNSYKHSSWLSLISDRMQIAQKFLSDPSLLCVAIDDAEYALLKTVSDDLFGKLVGIAVVRSNPQSRKTSGKFSPVHEYALFYGKTTAAMPHSIGSSSAKESRYPLIDEKGRYAWMNFIRAGSNDLRVDRPKSYYPIAVDTQDNIRIPKLEWDDATKAYNVLEDIPEEETLVWPIKNDNGMRIEKRWQRGHVRVSGELEEYRVRRDQEGNISIDFKTRMDSESAPTTWWDKKEYASSNYGAAELKNILSINEFDFPKAKKLVVDCLQASGAGQPKALIMDFFSGSGTTGHATLDLNRQDGGKRKFILAEMGNYFDTVLKPRIQKVVYAENWKGGTPVADAAGSFNGVSHCFKTIRLESYEDALARIFHEYSSMPVFSECCPTRS